MCTDAGMNAAATRGRFLQLKGMASGWLCAKGSSIETRGLEVGYYSVCECKVTRSCEAQFEWGDAIQSSMMSMYVDSAC